jgi:hypothetical protein
MKTKTIKTFDGDDFEYNEKDPVQAFLAPIVQQENLKHIKLHHPAYVIREGINGNFILIEERPDDWFIGDLRGEAVPLENLDDIVWYVGPNPTAVTVFPSCESLANGVGLDELDERLSNMPWRARRPRIFVEGV